jgi:hypothetical protein
VPGDAQATVSWSAPASDGGSAITLYTVTSVPDGLAATTTATSTTVTGLTFGMSYVFTVTAINGIGDGPASTSSNAVFPFITLSGTVALQSVSSTTAFALIGPTVTVTPSGGGASTTVTVSSDGSFGLNVDQPDTYDVVASADGFLSAVKLAVVVSGAPIALPPVELRAERVRSNRRFRQIR